MKEIVSFSKKIEFNTPINKIVSISLEHTISQDDNSNISGDLIVGGTYKQSEITPIDSPFSYKIPVDIVLDSKYDLSNMIIDIDDFTYEIVDNNKLKINVDILLDMLDIKDTNNEEEQDEIIDIDNLFLDKSPSKELEIKKEDNEEIKENNNETKEEQSNDNESLFDNLDSKNDTYSTYSIYIFQENDSLDDILAKYKISRVELEEYNDLNNLKCGMKLIIPNSNE